MSKFGRVLGLDSSVRKLEAFWTLRLNYKCSWEMLDNQPRAVPTRRTRVWNWVAYLSVRGDHSMEAIRRSVDEGCVTSAARESRGALVEMQVLIIWVWSGT